MYQAYLYSLLSVEHSSRLPQDQDEQRVGLRKREGNGRLFKSEVSIDHVVVFTVSTAQAGMAALMLQIEQGQSGFNSTLEGPYGTKRGTYSYKYLVNHMAAY